MAVTQSCVLNRLNIITSDALQLAKSQHKEREGELKKTGGPADPDWLDDKDLVSLLWPSLSSISEYISPPKKR